MLVHIYVLVSCMIQIEKTEEVKTNLCMRGFRNLQNRRLRCSGSVLCVCSLWCVNDSRLQKDLKKQPSRSPQLAHMYVIVITENDFFKLITKSFLGRETQVSFESQ